MKLHFEPGLDYQLQAIDAVCDLFRGQEICRAEFTVTGAAVGQTRDMYDTGLGVGNRLTLLDDELLKNLNDIQLRNGLKRSESLTSGDFTVEMETGTGKTYVYLRTIFELNKRYGFTKFVIVVPSIAIKEGVYKSLQMTEDHFRNLYAGVPFEYFLYDSARLGQVRNFATSATIQIMVVTVGAINKRDVNNLYKDSEKTGGEKPIDLIRTTFPIIIVDEPQSVDGGLQGRGREALDAMNPLCALRYSAPHVDKHHMVYRLDAVDAYEKKLVKQIEVAAATVEDAHNRPYVRLLSFETPLKFIFSHSALREGWDNPNVFQICALRDIHTEQERRQTIGRGLRLCVNQEGQRLQGFEVNTLTVIATESYEDFAEKLQKEIEEDTGIRFGVVEEHAFATITVTDEDGKQASMGFDQSRALWRHLRSLGYIDGNGNVQDSLRKALSDNTLDVPEMFAEQKQQITHVLKKLAGRLEIKNADERRQVRPRQAVLQSPEFNALWDRIKHKTTYRVQFDNERLIRDCATALQDAPAIPATRLQWRKAGLAIGKAGVDATERPGGATIVLDEGDIELPDLLTDLQDRTQLTRRSIFRILIESTRVKDFQRNPQQFIELAAAAINRCKRLAIVDGIRYRKLGDQHYYAQELFESKELSGYLRNMLTETNKSVYEQVVYDSGVEADFADNLEKNTAVKVYARLPGWFTVPTPLGGYNPDWAVLVETDGMERLYLVVETKGGLFTDELRGVEDAKITCGRAHFNALKTREDSPQYLVARSVDDMLARL